MKLKKHPLLSLGPVCLFAAEGKVSVKPAGMAVTGFGEQYPVFRMAGRSFDCEAIHNKKRASSNSKY